MLRNRELCLGVLSECQLFQKHSLEFCHENLWKGLDFILKDHKYFAFIHIINCFLEILTQPTSL